MNFRECPEEGTAYYRTKWLVLCLIPNYYNNDLTIVFYPFKVSCICFTTNSIIVGGWFRSLALYSNTSQKQQEISDSDHHTIPKYFGQNMHREDILSMAHIEPNMLASASYDGDIFVWDLNIDRVSTRLNAWDKEARGGPLSMDKDLQLK